MLGAHSCKQTALLYDSGNAPAGSRVLTFLSDGSPNGLVATPLIQAATQTTAPIRVCNITANPINIDGLQYTSIALRP